METDRTPPEPSPAADSDRTSAGQESGRPTNRAAAEPATVLVRGEAVGGGANTAAQPGSMDRGHKKDADTKPLSTEKVKLQGRLPALEDDQDVGLQKAQVVVRDGKPDLAFTGTLLASAAPDSAPDGQWDELRVYETSAGKYVFSKITRHTTLGEDDEHEAEIFEPEPSSKPSQLLRSARDLTRAHPLTWKDEAVDFFGYEPLAKTLYRKLGDDFEEHVN